MISGVDRSHHNDEIALSKLVGQGISFVWFKIAQWVSGEDKVFNDSWQEAKNTPGLKRGGYYFFDPRYDGIAQCKQMLSFGINFSGVGCMGGCVDVEDLVVYGSDGEVDNKLTAEANQWVADNWQLSLSRLNDFLNYFKEQTGLDCFIYTYNNYMREYYHGAKFPNNPMWISSLQATCPKRYDTGLTPEFWQYTYNWNKSDMDGNYFTGTQDELNKLAHINL